MSAVICPWGDYRPSTMRFCEADVCAWIQHPANTWSNLAYFLVGFYVLALARREHQRSLTAIGWSAIAVGIGSFFYHASGTFVGEVVDLGGMFLFSGFVLVKNASRLAPGFGVRAQRIALIAIALLSCVLLVVLQGSGVLIFVVHVVVAGAMEIRILRKRREGISYRPLLALLGMFALAWSVWWLDVLGIVCDPNNHLLQGHAAWHLLNSTCFFFLYRFYAQR